MVEGQLHFPNSVCVWGGRGGGRGSVLHVEEIVLTRKSCISLYKKCLLHYAWAVLRCRLVGIGEMKMIFFHKTDKFIIDASDFCICYQHVQKLECLGKRVK